jgi:hypothetical protein
MFKEMDKRKLLGVIALRDMIAREAPEKDKERTFTIRHRQGASPPIYLRATADSDFAEWLRLLRIATVRASAGSEIKHISREEPAKSSPRTFVATGHTGPMNRSFPVVGSAPSARAAKTSDQDAHVLHGDLHDIRGDSGERSRTPDSTTPLAVSWQLQSSSGSHGGRSSSSETVNLDQDHGISTVSSRKAGLRWRSMTDPGNLFLRAAACVSLEYGKLFRRDLSLIHYSIGCLESRKNRFQRWLLVRPLAATEQGLFASPRHFLLIELEICLVRWSS